MPGHVWLELLEHSTNEHRHAICKLPDRFQVTKNKTVCCLRLAFTSFHKTPHNVILQQMSTASYSGLISSLQDPLRTISVLATHEEQHLCQTWFTDLRKCFRTSTTTSVQNPNERRWSPTGIRPWQPVQQLHLEAFKRIFAGHDLSLIGAQTRWCIL